MGLVPLMKISVVQHGSCPMLLTFRFIAHASSPTVQKISSLGPISPNISTINIQILPVLGDHGFPSVVDFVPNGRQLTLWILWTFDANIFPFFMPFTIPHTSI